MGHFLQEAFSHLNTQPCSPWNVSGHYEQREKDLEKQTSDLPRLSKCLFFFARQFWRLAGISGPSLSQGEGRNSYLEGKAIPRTIQKLWPPKLVLPNFLSE